MSTQKAAPVPMKSTGWAPQACQQGVGKAVWAKSTFHSSTTLATGTACGKRKLTENTFPRFPAARTSSAMARLSASSAGMHTHKKRAVLEAAVRKALLASTVCSWKGPRTAGPKHR